MTGPVLSYEYPTITAAIMRPDMNRQRIGNVLVKGIQRNTSASAKN